MLDRRQFLFTTAAASAAQAADKKPVERPNILLIVADDLAAWMCGCYGNREIQTPNIDLLARTGMRFNNGFVCTPICSASRATLFTGRTPRQHGIHDFLTPSPIDNPPQGQLAPPASFAKETMISDSLSQAGYNCGYVGKWHMGNDEKPAHSFAYTYTMKGGSGPYNDVTMYLNGQPVQEKGYVPTLMTDHACQFLDTQNPSKPFFLTVSYQNPHTPYDGHPQKYYDLYKDTKFDTVGWEKAAPNALREKGMLADTVGNLRKAAAATTALDDQLPALFRKLNEKGFQNNTLILFVGDNGFLLGRHGLWSKGLASDPINMYDESVRVPFLISWPGKTPTDAVATELVSFYDVLPTLCDVGGAALPANRKLGGRSFLPILKRDPLPVKQPWRNIVFGEFRNTEMARDRRYKIVVRNGGKGSNELFDLAGDEREKINQWDNPQFTTVRDNLTRALADWKTRTPA